MKKYTPEQKQEVLKFFEDGCTVQEIFEASNIPKGTLYRWKSELAKDPKPQQAVAPVQPQNLDDIQERLARVESRLEEVLLWVQRKQRAEAKERETRDQEAAGPKFTFGAKR